MTGPDPRYPEPDDDGELEQPIEPLFPDDVRDDLASPVRRLAGRLVDVVVDFVATSLVGAFVEQVLLGGDVAPLGVAVVVVVGVPTMVEAASVRVWGRTAGMAVAGMRVVERGDGVEGDDRPVGWRPAVLRAAALMVLLPVFPILSPLLIGGPLVFDAERRGLHDRLAGTLVIATRGRPTP